MDSTTGNEGQDELSAAQLRDEAKAAYERARAMTSQYERELLAAIRQKPIRTLLKAAAVGFVIGAIFSRGRR